VPPAIPLSPIDLEFPVHSWPLLMALAAFPCYDDGWRFPSPKELPTTAELPDPLVMPNGYRIHTPEDWVGIRRTTLKAQFQHYMYGRFPCSVPMSFETLFEDRTALNGRAVVSELRIAIRGAEDVPIHLLLVTPANRPRAPIFLGLNFCGNHAVLDDERIQIPTCWMYDRQPGVKNNRASAEGRGKQKDVWPVDAILDAGFGLATIYAGELEPDVKDVRGGLFQKIPGVGSPDEHWGRIGVWAWGLSRAIDVLTCFPEVDSSRIAVVGHSRLGKTALLAGAFDERIALVVANQSGCGGAAPSRGTVGESVERINTAFPAWFNDNFKKFNDNPARLPFDQHCLVALCAPRPVLFTNAEEDTWANPKGQFDVLKAADPVYRLFGGGGLEDSFPKHGQLPTGKLGYFIRPGKHSMTREDWKCYLHFAKRHLDP
jgi:hypothetical protein